MEDYIDNIIIYDQDDNHLEVEKAGLSFDERGECEISMKFNDGHAVSLDGKLTMTYPTMEAISQSEEMKNEVTRYTGRTDLIPFDIALRYGKIKAL